MKKKKYYMAAAAVCFLVVAAVFGIGCVKWFQRDGGKENPVKVGVLLYKEGDTFLSGIISEMKQQVKAYSQESGRNVQLDFSYAEENQSVQNEQIDKYVSLDYDVLCVNLVDRTEAGGVIEKAMAADVPVVFFNREPVPEDLKRWDKLYYIGSDAKEGAVLEGRLVADYYEKYPGEIDKNQDGVIQYVLLEGESRHQDSLIRTEYSIQTLLEEGIELERLDGGIANWVRSQAEALMSQWLKEYGNSIELVISNNDDMALGALDAILKRNQEFKNIVGIDGTPEGLEAVENGNMIGTIVLGQKEYAEVLLNMSVKLASGESLEEMHVREDKSIRVPMYSINCEGEKRNLDDESW